MFLLRLDLQKNRQVFRCKEEFRRGLQNRSFYFNSNVFPCSNLYGYLFTYNQRRENGGKPQGFGKITLEME